VILRVWRSTGEFGCDRCFSSAGSDSAIADAGAIVRYGAFSARKKSHPGRRQGGQFREL
jgi:hypothetical protein